MEDELVVISGTSDCACGGFDFEFDVANAEHFALSFAAVQSHVGSVGSVRREPVFVVGVVGAGGI